MPPNAAKKPPAQRAAKPKAKAKPKPQSAAVPRRIGGARRKPSGPPQLPPMPEDLVAYLGGRERVELIVAENVPQDATAGDVLRLLLEARRLHADPMRRDIYLAPERSRDGVGTSYTVAARRDLLLAYAKRQPTYLGHDEGAIFEEDIFRRGQPEGDGNTLSARAGIQHETGMPGKRGALVGAWCAVEMRGEPPVVRILDAAQYIGTDEERLLLDDDDPKRRYPDACVIAAAMSNALRIAAGLNDVVGAEELTKRPDPLPDLSERVAPPIFQEGPVDDLDTRILDAYTQAQALDALLWPPAKVRGRLAGARAQADADGGGPAVLDRLRDELAAEIERDVAAETARRRDPQANRRRLAELRKFDPSTLEEEELRGYRTELAAIEALVAADAAEAAPAATA